MGRAIHKMRAARKPVVANFGQMVSDGSNTTSYSIAGVSVGAGQHVAVWVAISDTNADPDSVTFGGNPLTKVVAVTNTPCLSLWIGAHPGGGSGTLEVNRASSMARLTAAVYGLENLISTSSVDTAVDATGTDLALNVNTVSGGLVLAAAADFDTSTTATFVGVSEDGSAITENQSLNVGSAQTLTPESPRTVNITSSTSNASGASASLR